MGTLAKRFLAAHRARGGRMDGGRRERKLREDSQVG